MGFLGGRNLKDDFILWESKEFKRILKKVKKRVGVLIFFMVF